MAIGFCIGVLVCGVIAKSGSFFLNKKFKHLSNEALLNNSTQFMSLAEKYFTSFAKDAKQDLHYKGSEILKTIKPVKQTLDKYEAHLSLMEKEREQAYGSITEKLKEMSRTQNLLHLETGNLVKALRVPHVRGRWGEITLKRVAELSGMANHCDFNEQVSYGSGKGSIRPDMIVTLPENRKIIIDSKVPLMAYLDALEASDDQERDERMKDHARQVLKHVTALASKNYFIEISPTPEFVVLFIPGENFFSTALTHQPELIEKGVKQGVILATPTTLIALLKAVSYSWKQKKSYENAEEIRNLGIEMFSRLCSMTKNFNQLGKDIEKCAATYNRAIGSMETRVMSTAKKLESLEISDQPVEEMNPIEYSKTQTRELKDHK